MKRMLLLLLVATLWLPTPSASAVDHPNPDVPEGQSWHGEVFNEGPRQRAYLMGNVGKVHFPVTTQHPQAQEFFNQGVAQLHGFWYFEAERSFRQVAALDPDCAMAYWGMAQANRDNEKRSKGFIGQAVQRKSKASKREQMYIDAWDVYWKTANDKKKERVENYTRALEKILYEFPDDLEAKALLAVQLWLNRDGGVPITSHLAVDALLEQIFAVEPMHPAHHYRIHLWDIERAQKALASAARCGQAAPGIAHMWHMPGHIYSRLNRYDDACWQQEASARVDHAHMMRDRVLPDQIHNFAHNNEWLIRNLNHAGRVRDAVELAKNMIELPRHPKYNHPGRNGSYKYGRQRLTETLERYELWEELVALAETPYFDETDDVNEQVKRLRLLGESEFRQGHADRGGNHLAELSRRLEQVKQERDKAGDAAAEKVRTESRDRAAIEKAREEARQKAVSEEQDQATSDAAVADAERQAVEAQDAKNKDKIEKARQDAHKPFADRVRELEKAVEEVEGHKLAAEGKFGEAREKLKKAGGVDDSYLALISLLAGETDAAIKDARSAVNRRKNEVYPLAMLVDLLWRAGKKEEAKTALADLQKLSNSIDLRSPVFTRIGPIAAELGMGEDWRVRQSPASDVGDRPQLDSLGPFRWRPSPAPAWTLVDGDERAHTLTEFQGRPTVLIFYLGYGCLHCVEQLKNFAGAAKDFADAGLALAAVGTDTPSDLRNAIQNYAVSDSNPYPILLLSNDKLDVFQSYRAYDDFEQKPLHGTFVLDGAGRILWQDISFEPFMDARFVCREAKRLLQQHTLESM